MLQPALRGMTEYRATYGDEENPTMMTPQPKLLPADSKAARRIRRLLRLMGALALLMTMLLGLGQLLFAVAQ